jgi:glycerol transport system ATP-binding protein
MPLTLERVSKVVGGEVHLHPLDLELRAGGVNVVLGATLAGKTSLLRLMAGLDRPSAGRLRESDRDVTGVAVRERDVAMVYQQFINYPMLTVYENIASPLRVARADPATIDREVRRAADLLKLGPMLQRLPLELSGGQQQRTAIARAIVKKAGLVLLDEPLANLDYKLREELRAELPKIFAESGAIYVYATTEPTEALLLGGNTATLHEGRVTQFGPTIDVFRHPQDLITARTFADPPLNTIGAVKRGGTFVLADGAEIAVPAKLAGIADGPCTIGFRAHHLGLAPQTPASVAMQADVQVSEITGSESYIHVLSGGVRWVLLAPGIHNLDPGARIVVHLDTRHLLVFDPAGRVVTPAEPMAA